MYYICQINVIRSVYDLHYVQLYYTRILWCLCKKLGCIYYPNQQSSFIHVPTELNKPCKIFYTYLIPEFNFKQYISNGTRFYDITFQPHSCTGDNLNDFGIARAIEEHHQSNRFVRNDWTNFKTVGYYLCQWVDLSISIFYTLNAIILHDSFENSFYPICIKFSAMLMKILKIDSAKWILTIFDNVLQILNL